MVLDCLRVEEVFKKPSAKNCNRGLWQASNWSESLALALENAKLLKRRSFVSALSVKQVKL